MRHLVIVLGDQLNDDSTAFDGFDDQEDAVWMSEVREEAEHVWSHKARIAIFLAAMRAFRNKLQDSGKTVHYRQMNDRGNQGDLGSDLMAAVRKFGPEKLIVVQPGEHRVQQMLIDAAKELDVELEIRPDGHFLCTHEEFEEHANGRKQLRMEYFYREMRRRHDVMMDGEEPAGGEWNYDKENRGSFKKKGPGQLRAPISFKPDKTTQEVLDLVNDKFKSHPGSLEHFDWPVNAKQAKKALDDFIEHRLPDFGQYQDAMWTDEPFLYHSRISAAMNLKLLDPRVVIREAEKALESKHAPINAVEGFIRQVLGWREFVRGVYWLYMPEYLERNTLKAKQPLPEFFWTGETEMQCLSQAINQTLEYGYAHHIQRLMITGLFPLLLGVDPKEVHQWYLAVYVDAVEWVELPNSLGMSQYADDGVMASKPYVATGKYIKRMSNYCDGCKYDPAESTGEAACPFTTLYWDFLMRHRKELENNPRMSLQVKNLDRKDEDELKQIRKQAKRVIEACCHDNGKD